MEVNEERKSTGDTKRKGLNSSMPYGSGSQKKLTGREKAKEVNSQVT